MPRFSPPQGSNGSTGTAAVADVLTGFTFSNSQQTGLSGSMPNKGAVTLTPSGTGAVGIPAGYHNGAGTVSQVNVPAGNVLTGTTIAGVAGTMPNRGAPTWNPGTTNQSLAAGYYSGGTVNGDANLIAGNIKSGVSVFGVAGSLIQGTPFATGTSTSASTTTNFTMDDNTQAVWYSLTVSGLNFTPSKIIAYYTANSNGVLVYDPSDQLGSSTDTHTVITQMLATTTLNVAKFRTVNPLSVTSTGFTIPVAGAGAAIKWYAYQ